MKVATMYSCPCLMGHQPGDSKGERSWNELGMLKGCGFAMMPSLGNRAALSFADPGLSHCTTDLRKLQIALTYYSFVPLPSQDLITLSWWDLGMMTFEDYAQHVTFSYHSPGGQGSARQGAGRD